MAGDGEPQKKTYTRNTAGSASATTATDMPAYWGHREGRYISRPTRGGMAWVEEEGVDILDSDGTRGRNYFARNSSQLERRMRRLGLITDRARPGTPQVEELWRFAQQYSAASYQDYKAGKLDRALTPLQALREMAKRRGEIGGGGFGAQAPFTGTKVQTSTNSSVQVSNAETAKAIGNDASTRELGREMGRGEVGEFKADLNREERANPGRTTQRTSTKYVEGEAVSSDSTSSSSGGFTGTDASQFATDRVREENEPEWRRQRNQVTLMDAFLNAIRAPG